MTSLKNTGKGNKAQREGTTKSWMKVYGKSFIILNI